MLTEAAVPYIYVSMLFFCPPKEFISYWDYFFLKCLVQFTTGAIWAQSFPCGKTLNYGFNFFNFKEFFLFCSFLKIFIYLVAPGLSCSRRAPQLWLAGSSVAACGLLSCGMRTLSCGMHVESSSLTRDQTQAPALGVWSLIHCTTSEVPSFIFLNSIICLLFIPMSVLINSTFQGIFI